MVLLQRCNRNSKSWVTIKELIIYGIAATYYCVKATALDALSAGYKTTVMAGLSKWVAPDTAAQVYTEMDANGLDILKELEISFV